MVDDSDIISLVVGSIAAGVSLLSIYLNRKNNIELEKIKSEFELKKDEQAAIRNYEYEARQRLYKEFEPLLFLLVEHGESAYRRIFDLARTAKHGNLEPDDGWLKNNEYFKISTIHRLLLPLAVFTLMQRRLTTFDLDLVPYYKVQYSLSKGLYFTFADDYSLATSSPKIDYDPDRFPKKYKKQGIYRGVIDNLVEALITYEANGNPRLLSYGEFEKKYLQSYNQEPFATISTMFHNFHPRTMPVLWRILIVQAHIYTAVKAAREKKDSKSATQLKTIRVMSEAERKLFDWRKSPQESEDSEVFNTFEGVENYLQDKMGEYTESKINE